MEVFVALSWYLTPQNLSDITGILDTYLSMSSAQPKAVPCQVGPVSSTLSSAGVNMSAEVVMKL